LENHVSEKPAVEEAGGLLDVGDLCRMFEESEDSSYSSRKLSERDRDYVDNKQLTDTEIRALEKRGQPPVIINRIKGKIEFLTGMEIERRIDPKAFPRTPKHAQDADGASQALKYATDTERYDHKRTRVWRNMIVEGSGGFDVAVEQGADGQPRIVLRRVPWDRSFTDPASSEPDYSDAGYLGVVTWMDQVDALAMYKDVPDAKNILETTLDSAPSDTYDDKPKFSVWADKKRKRVRICQIWMKRGDQWHFAEFTKGGILRSGPSPYVTDKGESDCALAFASGYVDRDNNRYGIVREMISPQDEVNKRRSKALHLLSVSQTWYEDGAVDDIETLRREANRPDGTVKVNPGALREGAIKIERNLELATAQFQLLQESKNEIDLRGPNATMMGEKAQGSSAASGKAIIASQQGGMMEIGELLDNLRDLDLRVFQKVWYRIRQFWTAEKWIRVTDDERNIKWVVMNVPSQQMQAMAAQNPEMAQQIKGYVQNIAELECDIIINEAPDAVTPALEQWEAIISLEKARPGTFPTDVLIESAPNLKDKDKLLERLEQAQQQQQKPDPELAKAEGLMKLKAMEGQQKMEQSAQEHAQNMQFKQDEHLQEMALEGQKAKFSMIQDGQKRQDEMDHKRASHQIDFDAKRNQKRAESDEKLEGEVGGKADSIAEAIGMMAEANARVADSVDNLAKVTAAPRRAIRDSKGQLIGAEPVLERAS
jgi:hypothetical protein